MTGQDARDLHALRICDLVNDLLDDGRDAEYIARAVAAYWDGVAPPPAGSMRAGALIAAVAVLAGPRRTRPLAGVLFGALLSRAHAASRRGLEGTLLHLFDQRTAATTQITQLREVQADLEARLADVEMVIADVGAKGEALPQAHQRLRRRIYAATGRDGDGRPL